MKEGYIPFKLPGSESPLKSSTGLMQKAPRWLRSSTAGETDPTISTTSTVSLELVSSGKVPQGLRQCGKTGAGPQKDQGRERKGPQEKSHNRQRDQCEEVGGRQRRKIQGAAVALSEAVQFGLEDDNPQPQFPDGPDQSTLPKHRAGSAVVGFWPVETSGERCQGAQDPNIWEFGLQHHQWPTQPHGWGDGAEVKLRSLPAEAKQLLLKV